MTKMRLVHSDTLSCEPILRRAPDGHLLCVSQLGGTREPAPENRVYVFHSADGGDTWSRPQPIRPEDGKAVYATEVSVIGETIIVYLTLHNGSFVDFVSERMESTDSGYTWRAVGPLPGYEACTFPRGMIRARDGSLLMACQHYPIDEAENARLRKEKLDIFSARIDRVENDVLKSIDGGAHWQTLGRVCLPMKGETGRKWIWSEPTIIELRDGRIVMLMRVCGSGRLYRSDSADGGRSFSPAAPTNIPNPGNKPKLIRLTDHRIALIHTPNSALGFKGRNPLSLWISDDELESFSEKRVLSDFPGFFCYPDGFADDGHVRFTIEYNRHDILYVDADANEGAIAGE